MLLRTAGCISSYNFCSLSFPLSTPSVVCVRSLVPKDINDIPSLHKSSIIQTAAGVSTITPNSTSLSGSSPMLLQTSFDFFSSSKETTKGTIIPTLVNPFSCSLLIAVNSAFSIPTSSSPLLIPCQPIIGFASCGSSSPPESSLYSSVLISEVLTQIGFPSK